MLRKLVALPVAFALTIALLSPATALAAEGLSGYSKTTTTTTTVTTPPPATTSTPAATTPTPTTGTSPSKESSTPEKTTSPAKEPTKSSEPTATAKKATSLPFTGFDLRWTVGLGLVLLAMGASIVLLQRRQRSGGKL